jgi:hypothetical protein
MTPKKKLATKQAAKQKAPGKGIIDNVVDVVVAPVKAADKVLSEVAKKAPSPDQIVNAAVGVVARPARGVGKIAQAAGKSIAAIGDSPSGPKKLQARSLDRRKAMPTPGRELAKARAATRGKRRAL